MAYSSAWPDPDRYRGNRSRPAMGRGRSGDSTWGCGLDAARSEALARSFSQIVDDTYGRSRAVRREGRGLDGEG